MSNIQRTVIVVMDSCGVGAAPDAADYDNAGVDTLRHTAEAVGGLDLPNLRAAGLGNLHPGVEGMPPVERPSMAYGRMQEVSQGTDSTTGHWEIAGVVTTEAHATFTKTGFPPALVEAIERESGHRFIGNFARSGTVVIDELGPEHLSSGALILYTSGDSVFQIAAHTGKVPLVELYRVCEIARRHCNDYRIGRVIARPFEGEPGAFHRTYDRKDYSMPPPEPTVLDRARDAGLPVLGIGKIEDLFAGQGLSEAIHTEGDANGLEQTIAALSRQPVGIVFTNLVDLDMRYGHRENPHGYADGLAVIDGLLPQLVGALTERDLLFITADHGNDPTDGNTDHTREYVPLLVHGPRAAGVDLGTRAQFCDVAATIADALGFEGPATGESFLGRIA